MKQFHIIELYASNLYYKFEEINTEFLVKFFVLPFI
jgi:hypothetical protein